MTNTQLQDGTSYPSELDVTYIQRVIPHRYPFLFVDRVKDIVLHKSCLGIKCVTINEPQFTGHFPDMPVFPGVLSIEAMAQTSGVLAGLSLGLVDKSASVLFMSIDNAKFRRMIVPGDVMQMHIKVLRSSKQIWRLQGRTTVDDQLACEAQFTAILGKNLN